MSNSLSCLTCYTLTLTLIINSTNLTVNLAAELKPCLETLSRLNNATYRETTHLSKDNAADATSLTPYAVCTLELTTVTIVLKL